LREDFASVRHGEPLVSAVVVNWNGRAFVGDCVASLLDQTYPRLEVIVVDNGSTDGSVELLQREFGHRVRVLPQPTNAGFAGGNNLGIRVARGTWIALLNNDAVADSRWVEALMAAAAQDAAIGMCASKVYLWGRQGILDSAGGLLLSADGIGRGRGRLEHDRDEFRHEADVLVPSACAALYRRAMLDQIGLFDEDFFAYCEDSDLGLRGRLAGWRCRYAPDAVVHHRYSGSTSPYSAFKAFQVERNRIWVVIKGYPPGLALRSVLFTVARYATQTYGALVGRGAASRLGAGASRWAVIAIVLRAWAAALARLPEMWRRRRAIQARRVVSRREVAGWLRAHRLGVRELALKD
jgi:GT2 family glycosyltransferase